MQVFHVFLLGVMIFGLAFFGGVILRGGMVSDLEADHYGDADFSLSQIEASSLSFDANMKN